MTGTLCQCFATQKSPDGALDHTNPIGFASLCCVGSQNIESGARVSILICRMQVFGGVTRKLYHKYQVH